ncbi:uncharacterized protein LAESUDRAFT_718028 [Laetiporus sulphureus 93-53]|uniref:Uncharacterized protein n=1 Tax=Laetiporus sulphureus 93-53 TaxID=1314785 RepID=A0A165BAB8_9APHY|nr:uncharacterized protein LAESUDRAFT_718028 [Laetiporus sulphureus 93-53]KZT00610.1 hypothetical protein LAESUDRAFT_718028 [Laetiporus sulphureus 93-53]
MSCSSTYRNLRACVGPKFSGAAVLSLDLPTIHACYSRDATSLTLLSPVSCDSDVLGLQNTCYRQQTSVELRNLQLNVSLKFGQEKTSGTLNVHTLSPNRYLALSSRSWPEGATMLLLCGVVSANITTVIARQFASAAYENERENDISFCLFLRIATEIHISGAQADSG